MTTIQYMYRHIIKKYGYTVGKRKLSACNFFVQINTRPHYIIRFIILAGGLTSTSSCFIPCRECCENRKYEFSSCWTAPILRKRISSVVVLTKSGWTAHTLPKRITRKWKRNGFIYFILFFLNVVLCNNVEFNSIHTMEQNFHENWQNLQANHIFHFPRV